MKVRNKQSLRLRQKGLSAILVLAVVIAALVGVSAASYYLLKGKSVATPSSSLQKPAPTGLTITGSTAITDIEKDVSAVEVGSPDSDLQGLDRDASSL